MKAFRIVPVKLLQDSKFWLMAIAISLTAFQLSLTWKLTDSTDRLSVSLLYWVAVLSLVWKKRNNLSLESDVFSTISGLVLIALILIKSVSLFWFESTFIKISALLSFLGLGLIASGVKGLKQYWHELLIIIILLIPEELIVQQIEKFIDFNVLGAKFATFVLWYLGFEVSRQGANVILPTGAIEIYPACSGLNAMFLLLRLAVLLIVMFPLQLYKKILAPVGAVFLAFTINVFRLALMAVLVASSNREAFQYWHGEGGSQIFSTISILTFGVLCRLILQQNETPLADSVELTKQ